MQCELMGLHPSVIVTVSDENGNPSISLSAEQQRSWRHFSKVLYVQSQFDPEELEQVGQHSLRFDLAQNPSMRELRKVLGKLKNGKV